MWHSRNQQRLPEIANHGYNMQINTFEDNKYTIATVCTSIASEFACLNSASSVGVAALADNELSHGRLTWLCFHTDYINREYLFSIWLTRFKTWHSKVSLDISLIFLWSVFTKLQFIFWELSDWTSFRGRRQITPHVSFLYFAKSTTFCFYSECTQIKEDIL